MGFEVLLATHGRRSWFLGGHLLWGLISRVWLLRGTHDGRALWQALDASERMAVSNFKE